MDDIITCTGCVVASKVQLITASAQEMTRSDEWDRRRW